jgi:glycosyltransferase involved in cell wall biosynthesis
MPRIWSDMPDARLALVGRSGETLAVADRRVEVAGFVEDLTREYARSGCAVVPLLTGGGSPLKFVEALAYGLPVVATPLAASGLEFLTPDVDYLSASDGEEFASAVADVLAGRAEGVGARGRALVEEHYSIEALARLFGSLEEEAA